MSITGQIEAIVRRLKHARRQIEEQVQDELWRKSLARSITPNRIEVFDTHLLINQRTYVRGLIVGLPTPSGEGYPREMTGKALERIQELSFEGCKIMLSHGLIQISGDKAKDNLQQASFTVNTEQKHRINNNENPDLELACKAEDIVSNYRQIYFNSQRSFHSSFIIVIMGGEKEVFRAESYIISILKSEIIEVQIPSGRQLEMVLSALPFPVSESKAWVEVRSDTASILCTSTNLNSRTDDKGLYFGKDLKTNAEILIDLETLPARHFTFLGATGSGKTYSLMLLLMRMHDMLNYRIIYVTPKADKGTDYKAVARFYKDKACVVDIGDTGSNINPLQILFDKNAMSNSAFAYSKAYDRHKDLFIKFMKVWLPSLSENADSYLDETLNQVYETAGIIREQPETWAKPWPVMQNLYDIWALDAANPDLGTKQKTAEALKNKTYQITGKGTLSYINRPTTSLDLSKDFIVIDMSNVPELIKDAMNVLVTGMLHSRFNTDNDRDTIIAMDEAGVYLRTPKLASDMLTTLTQGRSHGVFLGLCTHQTSDFTKNGMREEFQTNMFCNIILGANIKNAIEDVGKYFQLSEEEKETLILCGEDEDARPGEGLLMIKGQRIPIRFEPTELEDEVIKGRFNASQKAVPDGGIRVLPGLQWLIDDQKVIFSDWVQGSASPLLQQGYDKHQVQNIGKTGSTVVYIPKGMISSEGLIKLPGLGDQTLDHYASVVQLAGLLQQYGAEEIALYHTQDVDISCRIGGLKVGFEYEHYNNKNLDIIVKKKEAALRKYAVVMFVTSSTDLKMITKAVGEKYCIKRGSDVTDFIESLTESAPLPINGAECGGMEAIPAL
jgi:Helicase HerA, central domain